jgi:hypothetical protein
MNTVNIRDKWNYTQQPEEKKIFNINEMAAALDVTTGAVYALIKKLDLPSFRIPDKYGHKLMYFSHESLALCREELERRKKSRAKESQPAEIGEQQAEHPLVTDPRFLKLSYFPDVTPACFQEAE